MKEVFVFWDNSNIFISAKAVAAQREGGDAAYQVRIQFDNLLSLALAGRKNEVCDCRWFRAAAHAPCLESVGAGRGESRTL